MKILITGTHFTPAVAVVEELKKYQNIDIAYVGRKTTLEGDRTKSVESKILPTLGVKFISIASGRLQRDFTIYTIISFLKIPIGFIQALYILLKEKPDVILSFGGYVGLPVVVGGWLLSIPIIIHEQTLVAGLANKISSFFADTIALSFDQEKKFSDKQTILTGNPIRDEILNPKFLQNSEYKELFKKAEKKKLPVILVMGGNQGSHTINKVVEDSLAQLLKIAYVIHQTGDSKFYDYDRLEKLQNDHYLVKKWIGEEYGGILAKVDLVISRAGINTLTELAFFGKVAIVIPIPFQEEQIKNALYFESLGSVKILPQNKLSGKTLMGNIRVCLNDLNHFKKQATNAKKVIRLDADKRLALETILLAKK